MSGKPTVISLFCGTGGSSLGYKLAGYKELLGVDFDDHAVECFKANFPEVPIWNRSVTNVTASEIMEFCNIKKGELDILDGSPPCQGFSTANLSRRVSDNRNDLFEHYIRILKDLSPKVFVMENVTGMIKGPFKGKFIKIMKALKECGYNVKCKQMNSMYYNVPQSRNRLIFIGVREDLNIEPIYPIPNKKLIPCFAAIDNIKNSLTPKDIEDTKIINKFMLSVINKVKQGEVFSKYHPNKSYFNTRRSPKHKPISTIIKQPEMIHYEQNRMLTINECKLLCSFPIDWKLGNDYAKAWARLGNAVMPNFMKEIALTIKKEILDVNVAKRRG